MKTYKNHKKRYYLFDWDDNILYMPTTIKLYHFMNGEWEPIYVSTEKYSKILPKIGYSYKYCDNSFEGFNDDLLFMYESQSMIDGKKFGPSYNKLKECLLYCNDFAIVTARSHSKSIFRRAIKMIIEMGLSENERTDMIHNLGSESIDSYLERQEYYAVNGDEFKEKFNLFSIDNSVGDKKKIAIEDYVNKINESSIKLMESGEIKTISVGFSDDDSRNIRIIEDLMDNHLNKKFPNIKFVIYNTADNSMDKRVFI